MQTTVLWIGIGCGLLGLISLSALTFFLSGQEEEQLTSSTRNKCLWLLGEGALIGFLISALVALGLEYTRLISR